MAIGIHLGDAPVSAIYRDAQPLWLWPADLAFQASDRGLYLDPSRLDLMDQVAAGGQPVTGPGQPVGRILRAAGTVDASQAVSPARPTLGRHPRSGRRNLANGAQAVSGPAYWLNTAPTLNGLSYFKVGSGYEGGVPYCDVRVTGTATGVFTLLSYDSTRSDTAAAPGDTFTASGMARVIAGSLPAGRGCRVQIMEMDAAKAWLTDSASAPSATPTDAPIVLTRTVSNASAAYVRCRLQIIVQIGDVVDVTYRVKALQFERGAVVSALQHNLGPHDVIEVGQPDLWYLSLDGIDDFLSTTAINWGSDEVTVIAAFARLSASLGVLVELSANSNSSPGAWRITAPDSAPSYVSAARGSEPMVGGNASGRAFTVTPETVVISATHKIGTSTSTIRVNGVAGSPGLANKGSGGFGTYPLYIGNRGGTGLPVNGRLYGLLAINRLLPASELAMAERYLGKKCGVTLP